MILLEMNLHKNDLVINQHIMQMIDADIFWYEKTFRAILMELQMIRIGKRIKQTSEEQSEKEMIDFHDESHVTLSDQRLYKGEKAQQDHEDMMSVSFSCEVQENWPRKCFQINKNKSIKSAMLCWESLEDSEQEEKTRITIDEDKETNNEKEKKDDKKDYEDHVESTVYSGN